MGRLKRLFGRSLAFLPSIVLAASWPGLWLLWPRGQAAGHSDGVAMPAPRGRYVRAENGRLAAYLRPDLFGRGSHGGALVSDVDAHSDAAVRMALERPDQTLPWDAGEGHHGLAVETTSLAGLAGAELDELVVLENEEPVFPPVTSPGFRLVVSADRHLTVAGFCAPEGLPELLEQVEEPWSARLWVELGDGDSVGHVLIEKGTGDDKVDRALVALMGGALAGDGGKGVSGWVTVEYGRF